VRVDVVTIFPGYLAPLGLSVIGRARVAGLLDVVVHDLRDFTHDRHRTVDDTPAGGGAGMVMRPQPWGEALDHVLAAGTAPGRGSSSRAGATRGSTSASSRTPRSVSTCAS
jgi:tRNA (guanine37-N1)-methyltransferase